MSSTFSIPSRANLTDYYTLFLSAVLFGYTILGKGFAYLGVPPLYIGEIALFTGFLIFVRSGCCLAALTTTPALLLAVTMGWVLLRTLPFLGVYGLDALRDSTVIMYGGFAYIVIALLLDDARRLPLILRYYGIFLITYIAITPLTFSVSRYFTEYLPRLPGPNIPIPQLRAGEVAAHLVGAVVFTLAGFRKLRPIWLLPLFATVVLVIAASRGSILALGLPITLAALLLGKIRQLTTVILIAIVSFSIAYAIEAALTDYREPATSHDRPLSAHQIADNFTSIVSQSNQQGEGTKTWRLDWWNMIIADTVFGPHFWNGRGFGLNLADADGFQDTDHPDIPALRSPHSVHMTLLARAGIPGVALWALLICSWAGMLASAIRTARRLGQTEWAGLFVFLLCYVMSIILNASFDVALEGPMLGIWFWCLIGFGIGSVMIYRCQMKTV